MNLVKIVPQKTKKVHVLGSNEGKPRTNLSKISRFIHIIIFSFLEPHEILRLSSVSKILLKSSHENGVWEARFPAEARLKDY